MAFRRFLFFSTTSDWVSTDMVGDETDAGVTVTSGGAEESKLSDDEEMTRICLDPFLAKLGSLL